MVQGDPALQHRPGPPSSGSKWGQPCGRGLGSWRGCQAEDTAGAKALRLKTQEGAGFQGGSGAEWGCRRWAAVPSTGGGPERRPALGPPRPFSSLGCRDLVAPSESSLRAGRAWGSLGARELVRTDPCGSRGEAFPGHHSGQPLGSRKTQSRGPRGYLGSWSRLPAHLSSPRLSSEAAVPGADSWGLGSRALRTDLPPKGSSVGQGAEGPRRRLWTPGPPDP